MSAWTWALAAVLTLGICTVSAFLGYAAGTSGNPPTAAVQTAPERSVRPGIARSASAKPKPKAVEVAEGTWQVGSEVKPGTYTTTAGADAINCYWARLKSFDGDFDAIISNGNIAPGGRGRIAVKASDKGLQLEGPCVWTRA